MNIEEIKDLIKNILKIVEEVPEPYRQISFETLLTSFLEKRMTLPPPKPSTEAKPLEAAFAVGGFMMPIDVRAFLQQQNIPEESLTKLFFIEGTEIRPIYKITATEKSVAQIQLALLTALENALRSGKFEFSIGIVRQKCKEHNCYDAHHFKNIFERYSRLFKGLTDEEHVELSSEGKVELAEIVSEIVK